MMKRKPTSAKFGSARRKYKPRKEMSMTELRRRVAEGYAKSLAKHKGSMVDYRGSFNRFVKREDVAE